MLSCCFDECMFTSSIMFRADVLVDSVMRCQFYDASHFILKSVFDDSMYLVLTDLMEDKMTSYIITSHLKHNDIIVPACSTQNPLKTNDLHLPLAQLLYTGPFLHL